MSVLRIHPNLRTPVTMLKINFVLSKIYFKLRTKVSVGVQSKAQLWMFRKNKVFLLLNPFKVFDIDLLY